MANTFTLSEVKEIVSDFADHGFKSPFENLLPEGGYLGVGGYVAITAAKKNHVSTLRFLNELNVDLGAEVCGNGIPGWTPLKVAEANGSKESATFLRAVTQPDAGRKASAGLRPGQSRP